MALTAGEVEPDILLSLAHLTNNILVFMPVVTYSLIVVTLFIMIQRVSSLSSVSTL